MENLGDPLPFYSLSILYEHEVYSKLKYFLVYATTIHFILKVSDFDKTFFKQESPPAWTQEA